MFEYPSAENADRRTCGASTTASGERGDKTSGPRPERADVHKRDMRTAALGPECAPITISGGNEIRRSRPRLRSQHNESERAAPVRQDQRVEVEPLVPIVSRYTKSKL